MSLVCFVMHVRSTLRVLPARARKGSPQSSALRCAAFVQTKGLSTLAALHCKPWEIPLPLQLLPPQAWAWAKALLWEQQQHGRPIPPDENLGAREPALSLPKACPEPAAGCPDS